VEGEDMSCLVYGRRKMEEKTYIYVYIYEKKEKYEKKKRRRKELMYMYVLKTYVYEGRRRICI
jgi:hypothetical protein